MIKRLWGVADNHALSFTQDENGNWQAEVPKDLKDGEYIVEIFAEDFGGNTAYYADLFFTIDTGKLCFHLQKKPYEANLLENIYEANILKQDYTFEILGRCGHG